jgi:rubrerythrin
MAAKLANKSGKSTFEYLAEEEIEHLKTLKTQYEALEKDKNWILKEHVTPAKKLCPLVMPGKKAVKDVEDIIPDEKVSREESDLEALQLAMKIKRRTIIFYCAAEQKIRDPAGKKMFAHLIEMENKHLRELEVQYSWLDQAGFWYDAGMMTD